MLSETIAELERLEALATAGPWWACNGDDSYSMNMWCLAHGGPNGGEPEDQDDLNRAIAATCVQVPAKFICENDENNLALMAALRNAAPALLAAAKLSEARGRVCEAAKELRAFVGVMCGHGPDSIIPETITTPLGVPVKVRAICADFDAALAAAEQGGGEENESLRCHTCKDDASKYPDGECQHGFIW